MTDGHWSDCAVHRAPAYPVGGCTCGGLDLAAYARYVAITASIPTPGSLAAFASHGIVPSLVEAEEAPAPVSTRLGATGLPGPHDGIAVSGRSDSMNLDRSDMPIITDFQANTPLQSITRDMPPHNSSPESMRKNIMLDDGGTAPDHPSPSVSRSRAHPPFRTSRLRP